MSCYVRNALSISLVSQVLVSSDWPTRGNPHSVVCTARTKQHRCNRACRQASQVNSTASRNWVCGFTDIMKWDVYPHNVYMDSLLNTIFTTYMFHKTDWYIYITGIIHAGYCQIDTTRQRCAHTIATYCNIPGQPFPRGRCMCSLVRARARRN
jgi:hypothetical protein